MTDLGRKLVTGGGESEFSMQEFRRQNLDV